MKTKPSAHKQSKFIIKDWADNRCFPRKSFDTFEDAWGFLYEKFDHLPETDFDEQMGEYSVEQENN